jgi:hypothetical protein
MVRMMSARHAARQAARLRGLGRTVAQDEAALAYGAEADPLSTQALPGLSIAQYNPAFVASLPSSQTASSTAAYAPYFIGGAVGVAAIAGLVYFLTR